MSSIAMKIPVVLIALCSVVSSGPLLVTPNAHKLSLLKNDGYEVISGAQDMIFPVASEIGSNGIEIPLHVEASSSAKDIQSDILVYGKFYVLRRNTPSTEDRNESKESELQDASKKTTSVTSNILLRFRSFLSDAENQNKQETKQLKDEDSILFPSDETTRVPKKYIRYRTKAFQQGIQQQLIQRSGIPSRIFPRTTSSSTTTTTTASTTTKNPTDSSDEIMGQTSEEFMNWVHRTLDNGQIAKLLNGEDVEVTTNRALEVGDRLFIQTPPRFAECPENHKRNHFGRCTPKYAPKPDSIRRRMNQGNNRAKLMKLFETLKALEEKEETIREEIKETVKEVDAEADDLIENWAKTTEGESSTTAPAETTTGKTDSIT